ncbi:MAG: hypothetical protein KA053_01565 [Lentimicrobiaceae bacterium]|nr:hypothetical protein [Lentimicrobiaceae bacterium]
MMDWHLIQKKRGLYRGDLHHLSPSEAFDCCMEGAVLVDVREDYMGRYKAPDVPLLMHLPCSTLSLCHTGLPKDTLLILADVAGLRSREACQTLRQLGYTQISNMAGGLVEWERAGLPLKVDKSETPTDQVIMNLKQASRKNRRKS